MTDHDEETCPDCAEWRAVLAREAEWVRLGRAQVAKGFTPQVNIDLTDRRRALASHVAFYKRGSESAR